MNLLSQDLAAQVRSLFPVLNQTVNGNRLVYLDSAATALKPQAVIDAELKYYQENSTNVHRGVHSLSQLATDQFEQTRKEIQAFIGAAHEEEIIFTKGCTEGINLVAQSFAMPLLKEGDEILVSTMEHHSNIVPWQFVCEHTGAVLKPIPLNDQSEVDLEAFRKMLSDKVKILGIVHVSNSIGTVNPVKEMIRLAKQHGAICLVDGAQAGPHLPINVVDLDADFYTLSCHKIFAPTGVGVLYGKRGLLESMPPYQGGGSMIRTVSFEKTTYAALPAKFEPGTPNIAGVIGLGEAIRFVNSIGKDRIMQHESTILEYGLSRLEDIPGVRLYTKARERAGVIAFTLDGVHPHDLGTILDQNGIAIRAGHHCTMPLMHHFGVAATARASISIYTTKSDIDALVDGVLTAKKIFDA